MTVFVVGDLVEIQSGEDHQEQNGAIGRISDIAESYPGNTYIYRVNFNVEGGVTRPAWNTSNVYRLEHLVLIQKRKRRYEGISAVEAT